MAFRPSKRRRAHADAQELDLTPIMNVFMIIIPFLLLTAVFAKTAIIDIYLPQEGQGAGGASGEYKLLSVKVSDRGFELGGIGSGVFVRKNGGDFDFDRLTEELARIKSRYPAKQDIVLLFNPSVPYDTVIKVMDASRETGAGGAKQELFPVVSLGEDG